MARSEMSTWLTPAASEVVDKAAKHAKSKGHSQVQPLHVAATLLLQSGPGSALNNACLDSLKEAGLPPKDPSALDVCFRVALERLPVHIERIVNPGHSNALHAALKRAQANQRRGTLEQSLQPILAVQVEIEQLIISILDDPSVSRVFKEAGFSSPAVKANMEDAVAQASLSGPAVLDSNALPRRVSVPMAPFSGASLETPAFRSSMYTSSTFGPVEQYTTNSEMHLDRGRMSGLVGVQAERQPPFRACVTRQDADSSNAFSLSSKLSENAAVLQLQKRRDQVRFQSSPLIRPPLAQEGSGPNEHINRIVEILHCSTKKRNPVLVSDSDLHSVSSLVTKEFSHRLMKGDVPPLLRGVQIKDLPVTSLSVGFLSREDVAQKLSKLRAEVDGCMPGGAIISVGDLQWLVESPQSGVHTHSQLVVQELQQMMTSYDRIWLLASASTETFLRCQLDPGHSLENQLGLEAVVVTALTHGGASAPVQSWHLRYPNNVVENSHFPQLYGKPAAAVKQFGMESGFCADCAKNFPHDCPKRRTGEQTTAFRSGLAQGIDPGVNGVLPLKSHSQMSWLVDQKESTRAPLLVKEENNPILERMKDARQIWPEMCCTIKRAPGALVGLTSGSTGSVGDALSSPMSEVVSSQERSPQKGSPQATHPLLSMNISNWACEPMKSAKSIDLAPHNVRGTKGGLANFLSGSGGRSVANLSGDGSAIPISWLKRDDVGSPAVVNVKSRMQVPSRTGYAWKNDLALGPTSVPSFLHSRDLREGGQQPLSGNHQGRKLSTDRPSKIATLASIDFRPRTESLNGLGAGMGQAVLWQKEAVGAVASAVLKSRSGESVRRGANGKADSTWLLLLGPDRVGKREAAKALSKLLFHGTDQLIVIQGWSADFRGKSPVDRLVEAVARQPFSVVLLEDVDRAGSVVWKNLLRAMECGIMADSNGREVNFSNIVFVMTCSAGANLLADQSSNSQGKPSLGFKEDGLLGLCSRGIRLWIDNSRSENVMRKGPVLSVVECNHVQENKVSVEESRPEESIVLFGSKMFKRKSDSLAGDDASSCSLSSSDKRCKKGSSSPGRAFALDLNLPVEDTDCADEESSMSEEVCQTVEPESVEQLAAKVIECAREQLPSEMFPLLDGTVVFKPFNLDGLTDLVLDRLAGSLEDILALSGSHVEIDKSLLELVVSYAWQTFAHQEEFLTWIENVLVKTVNTIVERSSTPPNSVLKLTVAESDVFNSGFADKSRSPGGGVELQLPGEILVGQ